MDFTPLIHAAILGIVEGLTEFLPISSTGHLILAGHALGFTGQKAKLFEIAIQGAAILAVCWEYRRRITDTFTGILHEPRAQRFAVNLFVAFLPLALLGLLFKDPIEAYLFKPVPVALAFIIGGFIILWAERRLESKGAPRLESVDDMRFADALKLGLAQAAALVPGTSRSGATIIGGLFFGMSRRAATEFSFFLAIPTLLIATVYKLYKERALLSASDWDLWLVGMLTSFISAFVCVRWLLRFISTHDFRIFAWYRIAFGLLVLAVTYSGHVQWPE